MIALDTKTDEDVETATVWSQKDGERLKELSALVTDPEKRALEFNQLHARLNVVRGIVARTVPHLLDESIKALRQKKAEVKATRDAVELAAKRAFTDEPLPGVGAPAWRALYEAARGYSAKEAYKGQAFPVVTDEARCVFCHQVLPQDAK
ncbi:MAG: hypothetical protein ACREDA_04825, partial [Methylocella sp.]